MTGVFEVRAWDAAGRLGELSVPRAGVTVETPALLPVVNPNVETIAPARLGDDFGAEVLITNSYIVHRTENLREAALDRGLHDLLGFDGAVMTDSGSFQLAEYGEIDVTTEEILAFQHEVGSDVGTPVDLPTPPDADRERAAREVETTTERLAVAERVETGDMLVTAPVQGSTYPDLREEAARRAYATDLDVFPVGGVVPLLNDYRYDDVVRATMAAKRGLGSDAPVHLFGAGHPMTFALAAAMGCDLFDSAAYAIYARDGRYLTPRGTEHLADLSHLPCPCPVCATRTPDDLRGLPEDDRERRLAEHNLHVSFAEIRRIRGAIRSGDLLELVEARARAHPALLDGYRTLLEHAPQMEATDPASKGTFFHLSAESADRPEVLRHHDRLDRLAAGLPDGDVLLTEGDHGPRDGYAAVWRVVPPFGPFPRDLSETYPLTAAVPERRSRRAEERAAEGVARLVEAASGDAATADDAARFTLAHRGWAESALAIVPDGVALVDVGDGSGGDRE